MLFVSFQRKISWRYGTSEKTIFDTSFRLSRTFFLKRNWFEGLNGVVAFTVIG